MPSFGFQSRKAQLSYPFLIFGMLLIHRYVYPDNPDLKQAEFALSLAALIIYIISRKISQRREISALSTTASLDRKNS